MTGEETGDTPEGWASSKLIEVFHLNPPKPKAAEYSDDLPVTFVPMPAVDADSGMILSPSIRPFAKVRKGFTAFRDDDVIIAKITPCMENGKAAVAHGLLNGLGFGSTEFHVLRAKGAVLPAFLFHFIRQESFRKAAEPEMTGSVGQKRVPAEYLASTSLPIPPLKEQTRIVSVVERMLEKVSAARERLEQASGKLATFRRSVVAAAADGRLTAKWRNENARDEQQGVEWLASLYKERLSTPEQKKLAKLGSPVSQPVTENRLVGWVDTRIGDICDCLDNLRIPVKKQDRNKTGDAVPYYGANGQTGWIDRHLFDEDLVLVVEDETFVGRKLPFSYVIRGKAWVNNHAHALRPLGGMAADYLNVVLSYYDFVPLTSGTTGRRKLNQAALIEASIRVAPPHEQIEIVRIVQRLLALADNIEQRAKSALRRVEFLAQAVLAKAFRGELVPTEAELARRENRSYEPASELLARLGATANGATKEKGTRKKMGQKGRGSLRSDGARDATRSGG